MLHVSEREEVLLAQKPVGAPPVRRVSDGRTPYWRRYVCASLQTTRADAGMARQICDGVLRLRVLLDQGDGAGDGPRAHWADRRDQLVRELVAMG
jgi:hypothetical protein